ncbi:InlB B-repeat-containing protein [Lysinibacillus piscis]|uniref:SLH domain-containing protein n=1 Tax=Lysinibacillus piscis TaxID=2518931 RepID=A0ABQ5NMU0_9BACI|nr:InlB B-repeat-containing protein [Lysinibacillus sp. KH24]GLC89633.1 hypothetical protein LYSBPC_27600 [Lysinibacillus sp. KH24]
MKKRWKQTISLLVICLLLVQTVFASASVFATIHDSLHIVMTTAGQPYLEGDSATSPVTIQVTMTTVDSADIQVEWSSNEGYSWEMLDIATPLVINDEGDHQIWFRIVGQPSISKHLVRIVTSSPSLVSASNIIYVNTNVTGGHKDGTSWANAFDNLQSALEKATTGDQIWIAEGRYTPTKAVEDGDPRYMAFQMKNGVEIYGGFAGSETTLEQRNLAVHHETILDGQGIMYHVFYHPYGLNLNETAVLDGVTITGGNANGSTTNMSGGGMYNSDGNSPSLTNVKFIANKAGLTGNGYGGAMYNNSGSSPILTNVLFEKNEATLGGGIYNGTTSNPTLTKVIFNKNQASIRGGGIYNTKSSPVLTNVTFNENESKFFGGGIYNEQNSSPTLTDVTFNENKAASHGGGIYNFQESNPTLTDVIFNENKASLGGGIYNLQKSSPILANVTFNKNQAISQGGGMFNYQESSPILTNVIFNKNVAETNGGGMYNWIQSNPIMQDVIFSGNETDNSGGGLANITSNPILTNVLFSENRATNSGGAIFNVESNVLLTNMEFSRNKSSHGSVMYNWESKILLTNVTISGNASDTSNKAAIDGGNSTSVIRNSIVIGNNGSAFANYQGKVENSLIDIMDSGIVKGKLYDAVGNPVGVATYIAEDVFVDFSNAKYQLKAGSPVINQGDSSYPELINVMKDLSGSQRIQGGKIDFGAYEALPYTISYHENGATEGNVPIDNNTYAMGNNVIVIGNTGQLVKIGYTFTGWNTQANGQGTHYDANATFQMGTANIILYAQWTVNPTYTMTYDANGATSGNVPQDSNQYEENEMVTVQGNSDNLILTGYSFAGWNTQADGTGIAYTVGDTFRMGATNITLYAQWLANPTYTVTYDSNGATGGTVPQDNALYEEAQTIKVQDNSGNLVKTGYTFTGWNTQANSQGIHYATNATFQMGTENIILYAQWAVNPPTSGGDNNPSLPPTSNGNNISQTSTDHDFSLPATIKITLHTNGGIALEPIEVTYNTKISDLPVPRRKGFRFDGWYQDEIFMKRWPENELIKNHLTLYAKWTAESDVLQEPQQLSKPVVIFDDIEDNWARGMIEELATQGIIKGYVDGTFRPNESISRQHVAVLFTRAFEFKAVRPATAFSDVASNHMYYNAISTLQQAGIIDGANGAFHPTDNITRAQLAKMLANTLQLTAEGASSFNDVDSSHWSAGYIAAIEQVGIALGDNRAFHPEATVTRAQLAAFLYRAINYTDSDGHKFEFRTE